MWISASSTTGTSCLYTDTGKWTDGDCQADRRDVLPDDQKLVLEIAKVIRLGFLQQNAFHAEDTCVPMKKQFKMMEIILYLYKRCRALIGMGMPMSVLKQDDIFEKIISIKYDVPNNRPELFDEYRDAVDRFYDGVVERNA